jgi:hypothetical protein
MCFMLKLLEATFLTPVIHGFIDYLTISGFP